MDIHSDNIDGFNFTKPQQIQTAFGTLLGMIKGIAADGKVDTAEARLVLEFLDAKPIFAVAPFNEFRDLFIDCIEDGIITQDELEDMTYFCLQASKDNAFYDHLTLKMQKLHGILSGIASDGVIETAEADYLQAWMNMYCELRGMWPFDHIDTMLTAFLEDGVIDAQESKQFIEAIAAWVPTEGAAVTVDTQHLHTIEKVQEDTPDICLHERTFCFTGKFQQYQRSELQKLVVELGGAHKPSPTKQVDYLIVGTGGNPCYTFSCYGRKVEKAMQLREKGHPIVIAGELDFYQVL